MRLHKMLYYCFFGFSPALPGKIGERALSGTGRTPVPIEQLEASHPYLCVVGPPPLRFQDPAATSSAALQPQTLEPASAAAPKPDATTPVSAAPVPSAPPKPASPADTQTHTAGQPPGPDSAEPAIIPDDMRPRVRPEEFLPFFQLPGSGASNAPVPNQPAKLPPSSATYRLE